jgi:hypothetical protein
MTANMLRLGFLLTLITIRPGLADTNSAVTKIDRGIRAWQSFWGLNERLRDYQIDLEGPLSLGTGNPNPPAPTRVEIYITGPREYIDKSDTPASLSKASPVCVLTNSTQIDELVSKLTQTDNKERITNVTRRHGYTYHVLLLEDPKRSVMHYRVFQTTEINTDWYDVYSRNDTGMCYFNNQMASWFRTHLPTNAIPTMTDTATNSPLK